MVGLKQEMRQSQSLVMTQQLQQSIKLLQLSAAELQEFIDAEIEKNPLLSREEGESDASAEDVEAKIEEKPESQSEVEMSDTDYSVSESLNDESYDNEWGQGEALSLGRVSAGEHRGGNAFDGEGEGPDLDGAHAQDKTLREHLIEQVHVDMADPAQMLIAEKLIDMLDDAGYLREDVAPLAEQLGVPIEEIETIITRLQQLDPAGVFARDLTECIRLQLREMDRLDPVMEMMLENLEMIGKGDLAGLRKRCGADEEDFLELLADIRRCNPKPASGFAHEDSQAVTPDVIVRKAKAGGWHLELNPDAMPRVLINRRYASEVHARKDDKEAKRFLSEQMANANWLVKALDQRAQTILKVSEEIVRQQDGFLKHGIRFLKPLVLKDIAGAIGMHESTISRVTTSKFMATPRGTLELKYFFTSSINSGAGGNDFSSKTVMYYIKELVEKEDPKAILSDDAIVQRLKDRNIDVARRTVTKYREEMGIPSSVVRRRQKQG